MSFFFRFISVFLLLLAQSAGAVEAPRLVVLVAVDQLRADRLTADLPGGLGRLVREGYVFTRATVDHGLTNTCPGHVVMSTGVSPAKAGIPGNSYVDHQTMQSRYCVDDNDENHRVIGGTRLRSPNEIRVSSLGDWLKQKSPGARVVAVSAKDRAAITLGGKQADRVFWLGRETGNFTTSGYYGELPSYVKAFNQTSLFAAGAGARLPETWDHSPGSVRKDDYPGESQRYLRHSGHPLNQGEKPADQVYYSPFIDELTGELARLAFEEEKLGRRGVTDLLAVSFSAIDTVGHLYGPYSAESADTLDRLDREMGRLLDTLDQSLDGQYLLALSSDHGVLPLPEWLVETQTGTCPVPEGRIDMNALGLGTYWKLYWSHTKPFGNPAELIGFSSAGIVINRRYAEQLDLSFDEVKRTLETYLEEQPFVREVWTQEEIETRDDEFARLFRHSYVPGKSGHLVVQLHEGCLVYGNEGTSHGSPYGYDRRVPLVFFGQGVERAIDPAPAHSLDIAPTLGARLGLILPSDLDGQVREIWQKSQ